MNVKGREGRKEGKREKEGKAERNIDTTLQLRDIIIIFSCGESISEKGKNSINT